MLPKPAPLSKAEFRAKLFRTPDIDPPARGAIAAAYEHCYDEKIRTKKRFDTLEAAVIDLCHAVPSGRVGAFRCLVIAVLFPRTGLRLARAIENLAGVINHP